MTEQATPKWHDDLRNWSRSYRGVGSVEKADLIDKALVALAEGRKDTALAVELYSCAIVCERDPNQTEAATLLSFAGDQLSWARCR